MTSIDTSSPAPLPAQAPVRGAWGTFVLRRLASLCGVLIALAIGVFFLMRMVPGDPIVAALGSEVSLVEIDQIREREGLNDPVLQQLGRYLVGLTRGDMGRPYGSSTPVSQLIGERFFVSLELAASAMVLVLLFSVLIGMTAAALTRDGRNPRFETAFAATTGLIAAIPDYLVATVLAFVFAVSLRWLPVAGSGGLAYLVLPAVACALGGIMTLARIIRVETLNVLAQDYITAARAQRLSEFEIYLRHVLPNVLTAALTMGGLIFSGIMGGAIIVEVVFARPGIGTALVEAVINRDYVTAQGTVLVLGAIVVTVNAIVDLILASIDTRTLNKEA